MLSDMVGVLVTFKIVIVFPLSHKGNYGFMFVILDANFSMKQPKLTSLFLGRILKTC